jgi:cutinase
VGTWLYRIGQHGKDMRSQLAALSDSDCQGSVIGQPLGDELRREYGRDLAIEGVDYAALVSTNYLPGGTDIVSEREMRGILEDINRQCPAAVIVCGGYS